MDCQPIWHGRCCFSGEAGTCSDGEIVWGAPATPCSDIHCDNVSNSHREELPGWRKKILGNAGTVCFCLAKEETLCSWLPEWLCLDISTVWASECWSNPVHVMWFTQLDCQHKQAQANLKRKRWKISQVIKTCLQMHLQLFLLHWQMMILSTLLLNWSRHFRNTWIILQKSQSVRHNCYLNPSCLWIQMRMNWCFSFLDLPNFLWQRVLCQYLPLQDKTPWRILVFAELVDRKVRDPCLSVNWLHYLKDPAQQWEQIKCWWQ